MTDQLLSDNRPQQRPPRLWHLLRKMAPRILHRRRPPGPNLQIAHPGPQGDVGVRECACDSPGD